MGILKIKHTIITKINKYKIDIKTVTAAAVPVDG